MRKILVLICAVLSLEIAAAELMPEALRESDNPIISICASRDNANLALVIKDDNEYSLKLLKFSGDKINSERLISKCKKISCVEFFGNDEIYYIHDDNNLSVYNIKNSSAKKLSDAAKFVLSPDLEKILFMHKGALWIKTLSGDKESAKVIQRKGASPNVWLGNNEFIFSCDGSLFKSTLQGRSEILVKGESYSPWFVEAALSPDGKNILAFSDDTKANVGAASRSLWLFNMKKKELRQFFSASFALWLNDNEILVLKNGTLLKLNINGGTSETLYKGNVESFTVSGGKIYFSESTVDDIGLYENSCLKMIRL